jgi:DNA repair protein RecO (recombination protein O)
MPSGAALFPGFYLNELLLRLLARQDPHPVLFDAYARVLPALAGADDGGVQAALRAFELQLLRETGVLPELARVTLTQQPVQDGQRYALQPEAGVCAAAERGAIGAGTLRALQAALDADDVDALRAACRQAPQGLRSGLRALLHYHLDSPNLRTRQLMSDLRRLLATP